MGSDNYRQSHSCPQDVGNRWHLDTCHVAWRRPVSAYQRGCRCPNVIAEMRQRWRAQAAQLSHGRGTCRVGLYKAYDEVVVERVISGDRNTPTTVPERRDVVARLTKRGWSASEIADLLGCTPRTVVRHRAATRKTVVVPLPTTRGESVAVVGDDALRREAA